jgi:hypothetical protein
MTEQKPKGEKPSVYAWLTGLDIEQSPSQESYAEYLARRGKIVDSRNEEYRSKKAREKAMIALPWGEYTHFASVDEDGGLDSGLACMRCMSAPPYHDGRSLVVVTAQIGMDEVLTAMLAHEAEHHS